MRNRLMFGQSAVVRVQRDRLDDGRPSTLTTEASPMIMGISRAVYNAFTGSQGRVEEVEEGEACLRTRIAFLPRFPTLSSCSIRDPRGGLDWTGNTCPAWQRIGLGTGHAQRVRVPYRTIPCSQGFPSSLSLSLPQHQRHLFIFIFTFTFTFPFTFPFTLTFTYTLLPWIAWIPVVELSCYTLDRKHLPTAPRK